MAGGYHNPFPSSLRHECEKACEILDAFLNPSIPNSTTTQILRDAQGLAIFSTVKAAFLGSARFGSGILVARLDDGSWSAPSAIVVGGVGFGGQVGLEFTNFIFVLPRKSSLRTFAQLGSLTLTANVSLALGPMGRSGEVGFGASLDGLGALWAMSKTNGLFGGVSVELATFIEARSSNEKLYQKKLTAAQLLNGEIKPPADAKMLMQHLAHEALNSRRGRAPDPEQPSERSAELPSGAENQPPSELSTQGAVRQAPVELHGESVSGRLEERETLAEET